MPGRTKVLLADSDAASVKAIMAGLRDSGIEVIAANDAVHAMSMARQERPDAVIVSARLAGGAVAAMQRIRSNVNTTHIPIIAIAVLTAKNSLSIPATTLLIPSMSVTSAISPASTRPRKLSGERICKPYVDSVH